MYCLHVWGVKKKRSICLLGARTQLKKAGLQQAPRRIVQERKLQHLARKSFLVTRVGEQTGKRSQNNQVLTGSKHKRLPLWDEYINKYDNTGKPKVQVLVLDLEGKYPNQTTRKIEDCVWHLRSHREQPLIFFEVFNQVPNFSGLPVGTGTAHGK